MSWWRSFLIAEDEAVNALIPGNDVPAAGNPHYTISQRLAQMRTKGSKVGYCGCAILKWIQNKIFRGSGDHCDEAMKGFPDNLPSDG